MFSVRNWRYFNFLNFSIFPRNDDFAGVESEKMRYLGIGLTDFESKTSFGKVIKFYNNFKMTSI